METYSTINVPMQTAASGNNVDRPAVKVCALYVKRLDPSDPGDQLKFNSGWFSDEP